MTVHCWCYLCLVPDTMNKIIPLHLSFVHLYICSSTDLIHHFNPNSRNSASNHVSDLRSVHQETPWPSLPLYFWGIQHRLVFFLVKPKTENQVTWIIISPHFKFPFLKVETVMTQPLHHSKNRIEWCCKMAFISLNAAHLWGVETVILSFSVYTFCLNNGLECFSVSYWEDIIGYFPNRVVMRAKWVKT